MLSMKTLIYISINLVCSCYWIFWQLKCPSKHGAGGNIDINIRQQKMLIIVYLQHVLLEVIIATTQLNSTHSWVGLIFLRKPRNHNHKTTKPQPQTETVHKFFSAPTQPNLTKFSIQLYFNPTRRFLQKKLGQPPSPQKNIFKKNQN